MCTKFRTKLLVYVHEFSELCFSEHQNGANYADDKVKREEAAVVEEGIEVFTHSIGCPLTPDDNAGDEVTEKTENNYTDNSGINVQLRILRDFHFVEDSCKAKKSKGNNVVKENAEDKSRRSLAVGKDVCAR